MRERILRQNSIFFSASEMLQMLMFRFLSKLGVVIGPNDAYSPEPRPTIPIPPPYTNYLSALTKIAGDRRDPGAEATVGRYSSFLVNPWTGASRDFEEVIQEAFHVFATGAKAEADDGCSWKNHAKLAQSLMPMLAANVGESAPLLRDWNPCFN